MFVALCVLRRFKGFGIWCRLLFGKGRRNRVLGVRLFVLFGCCRLDLLALGLRVSTHICKLVLGTLANLCTVVV